MKYIIDVPDNTTWIQVSTDRLEPYTEPDRQAVEDEVWEFAKKLISMSGNEVSEMWGCATNFGEVMHNTTYSEAKARYEAWRKQEDEIRVGDEVYSKTSKWRGVVTDIDDGDLTILDGSGQTACHYNPKYFGKTGKHFDSIKNLLEGLKEN